MGNVWICGSTLVFANTVRHSEVVNFRRGPSFHVVHYWKNSDPRQVARIDIGAARANMEGVPETAPFKDWNLVEGTHVYDGPIGVKISNQARYTILRNNTIRVDGAEVVDENGRAVVE